MPKIAFILTSHNKLGSSGQAAGSWLEELAAPYWIMRDSGMETILVSIKGGAAPIDPMSLEDPWLTEHGRRFLADQESKAAMAATVPIDTIVPGSVDAIYLVGGSATTWDFPHNDAIKDLVEHHFAHSLPIGAICHGVIGLVRAVDSNGEAVVKNRQMTGISDAEESMMGLDKIVPVLPETMLRKLRAHYRCAPPLGECVVVDPPFFTGQNPASALLLGEKMLAHVLKVASASA